MALSFAPFRDRRFWLTQLLVVVLGAIHTAVEALELLPHAEVFYFVPEALLLIPVAYAALNFGFHGSVATALWCTVLAMPNAFIWHGGDQLLGVLLQLVIVNAVAFFVGDRVDQEASARRQAEQAGLALQASEARYRGLFQSSADGVLLFDQGGVVREANPAADVLFGRSPDAIRGLSLAQLLGAEGAAALLSHHGAGADPGGGDLVAHRADDSEVLVEAACTSFAGADGQVLLQASLRDVTQQRQRQRELQTYAAHILQAQEEERRRIAQELHDETLQGLILLCRRLDTIEDHHQPLPPGVEADIDAARLFTEELVASLRNLTRAVRPPALDDLGPVTTVRRLLDDLGSRAGIRWELTVNGEQRRLNPNTELGLFRIAQEAIRNVERHAGASSVNAVFTFEEHRVQLQVRDDGRGFQPARRPRVDGSTGLGLIGMQERATLLGGTCRLHTAPGRGTTVAVSLPA